MNKVRRLTPIECERLQGFPDNWTLIGEPEEVEVKDYDIKYDENGDVVEKTQTGTHKEIEYFYTDKNGKRKKCSDSARYKALGNSIATPYWFVLMRRIAAQYERPATLGSLFDGIGGFPYCWERCNGEGTAIWASEIEDFCVEVTKRHFVERKLKGEEYEEEIVFTDISHDDVVAFRGELRRSQDNIPIHHTEGQPKGNTQQKERNDREATSKR